MRIKFSKHTLGKLQDKTSKRLGIRKEVLKDVLQNPDVIDNGDYPVIMAVKSLTEDLSLCVIYKFVEEDIRIITFFPARRDRYESKILSGR